MTDRELLQQALYALEAMQAYAEVERKGLRICDEAIIALRERLAQPEPVTNDWSVFNTGAEVASGLSFSEAWEYLTPERLHRGWSAVCVVNKDNLPTTSPSAPHSADSAGTFCNEPEAIQQIAKALRQHELILVRTAASYHVMSINQLDAYDK